MLDKTAAAENAAGEQEVNQRLIRRAALSTKRCVDDGLEQNGVGQWRVVKAAQEGHLVRDEHHLADDQRAGRRDDSLAYSIYTAPEKAVW